MDHGLQLFGCGVRPCFLPEAKSHTKRYHTYHHRACARIACKKGNCRQSRKQDHERVAYDFQNTVGPALLPLLCDLVWTHRARTLVGLSLRQASEGSSQVPKNLFAILASRVENRRQNMNILFFRFGLYRRLARASRWRGEIRRSSSSRADQSRSAAILD